MNDIQILLSIISLFVGIASISISVFINKTHKKKSLFFFIGLNVSFFLIQNSITLNAYSARLDNVDIYVPILSKFLDIAGTSFSSFFGMMFINSLFGKEISNIKKIMISAISAFQFVAITICFINNTLFPLKYAVKISIILVIIYQIMITILNYQKIVDKELKKAIIRFIIITLIFLPFITLETFRSYIPLLRDVHLLKLLSLPTFFLVINIYTLLLANTYFNSPAFIENNNLTGFFKQKYSITEKEGEVIELLLKGFTYKQIAEKLYIANKTVDNHVQNIYKKLEVSSKIQLSNLIRSKEK